MSRSLRLATDRTFARRTFLVATVAALVVAVLSFHVGEVAAKRSKHVVIATLLSHPALDQIITSLREELASRGYAEGRDVTYTIKNANGNVQLASAIANDINSLDADVVVPITTPMSQAVTKVVRAPIVFSAVTDPLGAKIVKSLDDPGAKITGVSDAWPYEEQLRLLKEILPSAKTVGVLFNPGDAASDYGIRQIRSIAARLGLSLREGACNTPAEVGTVAESLVDRVDALFLSSDATVISAYAAASRVSFRAKKPLIVGDSGTVEKGGLATVSVGYAGVGRETAKLVDQVLRGEHHLPVVVARGDEIYLNTEAATRTGIKFSPELLRKAKRVYSGIP
jgi:putative ABC transport system substrate-binding protein